ncbi:MAG TPA: hypothetical protein V6C97_21065 [Oculatellaceae cyanobacterium]
MESNQIGSDLFSVKPREVLPEAILEGGPLHGQILKIEAIEERELESGFYKHHAGVTYTPETGGRFAVFRWVSD